MRQAARWAAWTPGRASSVPQFGRLPLPDKVAGVVERSVGSGWPASGSAQSWVAMHTAAGRVGRAVAGRLLEKCNAGYPAELAS
jgi:hypothetical protein